MIEFLKLDIDILDNDHQQFFEIFEQIENDKIDVTNAVAALKDYSRIHFAHEEQIMLLLDYPDFKSHICLHSDFLNSLESMKCDKTSEELVNISRKWLLYHISLYDYKLAQFIKEYLKTAESLKEII